jgi:hypothetical protein
MGKHLVVAALLGLVACGGTVAPSGAQDGPVDAVAADSEADSGSVGQDVDAGSDAAHIDAGSLDAAPEASCYNAAGLWICDGGWPAPVVCSCAGLVDLCCATTLQGSGACVATCDTDAGTCAVVNVVASGVVVGCGH